MTKLKETQNKEYFLSYAKNIMAITNQSILHTNIHWVYFTTILHYKSIKSLSMCLCLCDIRGRKVGLMFLNDMLVQRLLYGVDVWGGNTSLMHGMKSRKL